MIMDSGLGKEFWSEAVAAFCYVKSLVLMSHVPGVIPIQQWYPNHAHVNVLHLCRWGCQVTVTDLNHIQGKLGNQAWTGYFIGYIDQ